MCLCSLLRNLLCACVMLLFVFCLEPNSPTDLQVTDFSTTSVEFEWNAPDGKSYTYKYTLTKSSETTPAVAVSLSGTDAEKTGLIHGTTYVLNVIAIRNGVESDGATTTFTLSMCGQYHEYAYVYISQFVCSIICFLHSSCIISRTMCHINLCSCL